MSLIAPMLIFITNQFPYKTVHLSLNSKQNAFPLTAHNLRKYQYAPRHINIWSKQVYSMVSEVLTDGLTFLTHTHTHSRKDAHTLFQEAESRIISFCCETTYLAEPQGTRTVWFEVEARCWPWTCLSLLEGCGHTLLSVENHL